MSYGMVSPTFGCEIETEFSGLPRVGCRLARITLLWGWDASLLLLLALCLSLKVFTVWTSPIIRKNKWVGNDKHMSKKAKG